MKENCFVLKGDICFSVDAKTLRTVEDGFLVCEDGVSAGVFETLPKAFQSFPLTDWSGRLILPGLTDLHIHAPQYAFRGLGMDLELLDWLEAHVFPEETKYRDLEYAQKAYSIFVEDIRQGPNTRACIFATAHTEATKLLMELLEDSGLVTMVGRVNMDRNCPEGLREPDAASAAGETARWLEQTAGKFKNTYPILTPRFIPSCSDELMGGLARLQKDYRLPVQSHLSENAGEVDWVRELCPGSQFYGDAYDAFGLFGGDAPTIMAHCVLSGEAEIALMKKRGVFIAHCPESNTNLSSGVAPVRRYLDEGMHIGLGSDVAGGSASSIFRAMADAVQTSKLRWRLWDQALAPLTVPEAFWLGTVGGGAFFGKVGSFAPGYEFDAVVLDDSRLKSPLELSVSQRLERAVYLSEDRDVIGKYVRGRSIKGKN